MLTIDEVENHVFTHLQCISILMEGFDINHLYSINILVYSIFPSFEC